MFAAADAGIFAPNISFLNFSAENLTGRIRPTTGRRVSTAWHHCWRNLPTTAPVIHSLSSIISK